MFRKKKKLVDVSVDVKKNLSNLGLTFTLTLGKFSKIKKANFVWTVRLPLFRS